MLTYIQGKSSLAYTFISPFRAEINHFNYQDA